MFSFLPRQLRLALSHVDIKELYEIRVRANRPVCVNTASKNVFLSPFGVTSDRGNAIVSSMQDIADIVLAVSERSIYSYADKICKGFITKTDGVRIGLCGECVMEGDRLANIKNISSLNIRIPHAVKGCADEICGYYSTGVKNTLIISPPGVGKTTVVRDLAEQLSEKLRSNVLVCDERNEIFPLISGGDTIDSIVYSPKKYSFENAVRAMSPDVMVTDEICGEDDVKSLYGASLSGVNVIATAHGSSFEQITKREEFRLMKNIFELYVTLDESKGKGTICEVYVNKGQLLKKCL